MKFPLSIWLRQPWKQELPFWISLVGGAIMVSTYALTMPCWFLLGGGIAGALFCTSFCVVLAGFAVLYFVPVQGGLREKLGIRRISKRSLLHPAFCGFLWIFLFSNTITPLWKRLLTLRHIPFEEQQPLLLLITQSGWNGKILLFLTVCVLVPLMEELLFRRYLNGILRKAGAYTSLIAGAFIFGAAHNFILGLPALVFMGIVFQLLYSKSRNFAVPVLCHGLVNTIAFAATLII